MGGKRKKPEPRSLDEVRAPHALRARRHLRATLATTIVLASIFGFMAAVIGGPVGSAADVRLALGVVAGVIATLGALVALGGGGARHRLHECRDLIDAEHFEAAVPTLKELMADAAVGDEAAYLVALAYDRQGAAKLALGTYEQYLERHPKGSWSVEARVRVEELKGALVKARPVVVKTNCPFCKSELLPDAPVAECATCGTPHHAGCYEEQGGCAVYGCESKTAKARVRT